MDQNQKLGLAGVSLLVVGVFTPLVSIPIAGTMSYLDGDGVFVLILAGIAVPLIFWSKFRWLWLPGLATLGMLAFSLLSFQQGMAEAKNELEAGMQDNPFGFIAEGMVDSVSLEWGWLVLISGAGLLLAAAYRGTRT